MIVHRLAAIDLELDDIATRIERLRRRRETLLTERRGIVAAHMQPTHHPILHKKVSATK